MLRRRNEANGKGEPKLMNPSEDEFYSHFPALWDFVTLTRWPEDGSQRTPGTLLIFLQDGVVKACLKDGDTEETMWQASEGLWDLLQGVDRHLAEGTGTWRKKATQRSPGRK